MSCKIKWRDTEDSQEGHLNNTQEIRDRGDTRLMLKEWRKEHGKCPNCGTRIDPSFIECGMSMNEHRLLQSRLKLHEARKETSDEDWVIQTPEGSIFIVSDKVFREHVSIEDLMR